MGGVAGAPDPAVLGMDGKWGQSFVRMFALLRGVIWRRLDILALLDRYGTGKGSYKSLAVPSQAYFPGFA
jgi:hypothetical protein